MILIIPLLNQLSQVISMVVISRMTSNAVWEFQELQSKACGKLRKHIHILEAKNSSSKMFLFIVWKTHIQKWNNVNKLLRGLLHGERRINLTFIAIYCQYNYSKFALQLLFFKKILYGYFGLRSKW